MKSIVVEEQEQEEGNESESETGFVDLDRDALYHVLMRVDMFTLGRAACVNKLWRKAARDNRLWQLIFTLHNVVKREEQESETGFEDLDEDRLRNELKRLHKFTSMPAACVNKPCCDVAESERFWERVPGFTYVNGLIAQLTYRRRRHVNLPQVAEVPPLDFYSIDPQVFSSQIGPWV